MFRRSYTLPAIVSILSMLWTYSDAQIGQTVCICSPASYVMTFNFSQTCNNTKILGAGINKTDCAIAPFQNNSVTDKIPVTVGSIDILELDSNLMLLTQKTLFGTYRNGDTFSYTSVSNDQTNLNGTAYPTALQVSVIGNNAGGETLFFAGLVVYATDCSAYPTILEGSSVGWITFVSTRFCVSEGTCMVYRISSRNDMLHLN